MKPTKIDRQESWCFINGQWSLNGDGEYQPPSDRYSDDEKGLQCYRFAFCEKLYSESFRAAFQIRHAQGHCDTGLIFRARGTRQFWLLHFPDCGQASRAQNFWVALSQMQPDGVLRIHKLRLVPRVASHPHMQWHDVEVSVQGSRLVARIDGKGIFEADDIEIVSGALGLMSFNGGMIHNVQLDGAEESASGLIADPMEPSWFYPVPDVERYGKWQQPLSLLKVSHDELLLHFNTTSGLDDAHPQSWIVRSRDSGASWSPPQPLTPPEEKFPQARCQLHLSSDGTVLAVTKQEEEFYLRESSGDLGRWSSPTRIDFGPVPEGMSGLHFGPQTMVNLRDGSMVLLLYGATKTTVESKPSIHTWSSYHCQAYSTRSADGGRTWSPLTALDNRGLDVNNNPIPCNFDLTEVCAAEVRTGNLLALIRPIYSPWMWETWSTDGGCSWGPCVRGPFAGYGSSNLLRTSNGTLLVAHRLPGLTVHASKDGGATWDEGTMIDSGLWAMGQMVEAKPDVALYVYWDTTERRCRAMFLDVRGENMRVASPNEIPTL